MIKLDVKDYCHECFEFEDEVQPADLTHVDGKLVHVGDTVIRCKYRHRCERLRRRFEKNPAGSGEAKKVVIEHCSDGEHLIAECPSCRYTLGQGEKGGKKLSDRLGILGVTNQYCRCCGQKLDWSEVE